MSSVATNEIYEQTAAPGFAFDASLLGFKPDKYCAIKHFRQSQNAKSAGGHSSAKLEALLNALPAGVVVVNSDGVVDECNPAALKLLGEPLVGAFWRDVISRAFDPMPSGQDMRTKSGRIVNISTCPLGQNIPGQIVLLHDVTMTRQLQAKVEQQQRLAVMGQMAAQLAHQIRTPISSALLYASHLQKNHLDEAHRRKFTDKVLKQIHSLEKLVKEMLLFSKNGIEQGVRIRAADFFTHLRQQLHIQPQTQLELIDRTRGELMIFVNQELLISALANLLENAEQAVSKEKTPKIKLSMVQQLSGFIDFVVKDNGSGIDKSQLHKIYEPFYTTRRDGTGLGLAVVKSIAHGHRGELILEQTSSSGTTFVIRIPVIDDDVKHEGEK